MRLSAAQLAQLALDVGWRDDDVSQAVALALATSGGDTAWHSPMRPGKGIRYWGLWGIDTDTFPGFLVHDLTLGGRNAQVAYVLWTTHGAGWDWSPAWPGERWRAFLQEARQASLEPRREEPVGDQPPADDLKEAERAAGQLLQDQAAAGDQVDEPPPVQFGPHTY